MEMKRKRFEKDGDAPNVLEILRKGLKRRGFNTEYEVLDNGRGAKITVYQKRDLFSLFRKYNSMPVIAKIYLRRWWNLGFSQESVEVASKPSNEFFDDTVTNIMLEYQKHRRVAWSFQNLD